MGTIFDDVLLLLSSYGLSARLYFETHFIWLEPAVLGAFTLTNSLRILAYVPQIVKAARDTGGASAISVVTWSLFLLSHLATVAYAVVCVGDLVMAVLFFGNAMCCIGIVAIALTKRRYFAAVAAPARHPAMPASADARLDDACKQSGLTYRE